MTAIADSGPRPGPGQLIRWHYLAYSALALAVMTAAISRSPACAGPPLVGS
jgi:hypothetical protein